MFLDRRQAGRQLGLALKRMRLENPVVLALPRGGVPVGFEAARILDAPLDIVVVRKLGAPGQHELGLGAIVDGDNPQSVLNQQIIDQLDVSPQYIAAETESELKEIRRRQDTYRKGRPPLDVAGRTAVLVDDGIATGGTIRAALRGIRRMGAKGVVLAVPVAPRDAVDALRGEADAVLCLETPDSFFAIGEFYEDFSQTTDQEVIELLEAAHRRESQPPARKRPLTNR